MANERRGARKSSLSPFLFCPLFCFAQGIAYLDFGFIEPALLAAVAKTAKEGQAAPKGLEGHLVTRVAMDVSALVRLQQQIQQVLVGLRDARKPKAKE